jgi:hypothetical protein
MYDINSKILKSVKWTASQFKSPKKNPHPTQHSTPQLPPITALQSIPFIINIPAVRAATVTTGIVDAVLGDEMHPFVIKIGYGIGGCCALCVDPAVSGVCVLDREI